MVSTLVSLDMYTFTKAISYAVTSLDTHNIYERDCMGDCY